MTIIKDKASLKSNQKRISLIVILCILWNFSFSNTNAIPRYTIKFSASDLRLVSVEASFIIDEPNLEMNPWGIPPAIDKGWAEFLKIKSIKNGENEEISYVWNSDSQKWDLNIAPNSLIKIRYDVTLEHDKHNWDAAGGVDGRPTIWADTSIFWNSAGLIIYNENIKNAQVDFELPETWDVSTPWLKSSPRSFVANDLDELVHNLIMVGKHQERVLYHDKMSITIAAPHNFSHRIDLIEQSLESILPSYKRIFGELPEANYLICASSNLIQDGEAYTNSFHQMFIDKDLEYTKIVWTNILAHEMFHYWNGTKFLIAEDYLANYWFSEGFTNYYSSLSLLRSQIVSEEEYLRFLAYQFSKTKAFQEDLENSISLVSAGKSKLKNWNFIYGGGTTIAFILDVKIRSHTNNQKSLDDFMKTLYLNYGKSGEPIDVDIQVNELSKMTGIDFQPFFKNYVTGTEPFLPLILSTCDEAGLSISYFQDDFYLKKREGDQNIFELMSETNVKFKK